MRGFESLIRIPVIAEECKSRVFFDFANFISTKMIDDSRVLKIRKINISMEIEIGSVKFHLEV